MPAIEIPQMNSVESLDDVINWLGQVSKTLNYLLYHLDENNVTRAGSVVADWVYAGNIQAAQIDVALGKISTAQIESLIVGDNVIMGENASIAWEQVLGTPNTTYIDQYGIYTGELHADQITAGRIDADYLATDISQVYRLLNLGSGTASSNAGIVFNGIASIDADAASDNLEFSAMGYIIFNSAVSMGDANFFGNVDFSYANVDGLDIPGYNEYVHGLNAGAIKLQYFSDGNYLSVWIGSSYRGDIELI